MFPFDDCGGIEIENFRRGTVDLGAVISSLISPLLGLVTAAMVSSEGMLQYVGVVCERDTGRAHTMLPSTESLADASKRIVAAALLA